MQNVILKSINKDRKKEHGFFLFFNLDKEKKKARIHTSNWLSITFPQGKIQFSITHKVKKNNIRADAVINISTN